MSKEKRKIYIIGAGISGLSVAWKLAELGHTVEILEKEAKVGGMAGSFAWGHFKYLDFGPHIYHTPDEEIKKLWQEKFGDLLLEGEFWAQNIKDKDLANQSYDYPLSLETINSLPVETKNKVLYELKNLDISKRNRAKNFNEYVEGLVGPTLQQLFFTEYPEKVWGVSTLELTANWAPKRINITEKSQPFHAGQWCATGKFGSGAIMDKMAEEVEKAGGFISLETPVTDIKTQDNLITEIIAGEKKIIINPEDVIISTGPVNKIAQLLGVNNELNFRGVKLIFLAIDKPFVLKDKYNSFYFDDKDIVFHRLGEQKKSSVIGFPEDKTVLTVEVAYSKGDEFDLQENDKIIERTVADLIKLKLIKENDFMYGKVISLPHVYPLLTNDKEEELAKVLSQLRRFKQLYLTGTGGEFHYADLQILYAKSVDLAIRLNEKKMEAMETTKHKVFSNFNKELMLGDVKFSFSGKPFIIAEIGLNHNGDINIAKNLIDEAVTAGCSAVKLQTYKTTNRLREHNKTNRYAEKLVDQEESSYDTLKRMELTLEEHKELFAYAKSRNIEVFSTPFDLESLDLLESLNCKFYKISSMDLVNLPLIKAVANTQKPMIVSTGMSTLGQIEDAMNVIKESGNKNVILLHCVSAYPAAPEDMNLKTIKILAKTFNIPVGLSDHSIGLTVTTVALAMGVKIIERHFTLDRFMEGPDHILSSDPKEMRELVRLTSLVPKIQGFGGKAILESEMETINKFKKCLYAKENINEGEIISADKISISGPGGGILPKYLDIVIGRVAKKNIIKDELITWDSF